MLGPCQRCVRSSGHSYARACLSLLWLLGVVTPARGADFPGAVLQDFNTSLHGWTARDGTYIHATPADWGGVYQEYWSPPLGQGDRALTFYKSQVNDAPPWWRVSFTNTTGKTIHTLQMIYDLESPWARFNSATIRDGAVRWYVNTGSGPVAVATSPALRNTLVTTPTVWFDDAQMDALGLAARELTFTVVGLTIQPDATFTLEVRSHVASSNSRNMNHGIDNLIVLSDVGLATHFADLAAAPNPRAVGTSLDALAANADIPLLRFLLPLATLPTDEMQSGLSHLTGEIYATQASVALLQTTMLLMQLNRRLRTVAGTPEEVSVAGSAYGTIVRGNDSSLPDRRWDAWVLGSGWGGQLPGSAWAQGAAYGCSGVLAGVERAWGEHLVVGAYGGASESDIQLDWPAQSTDGEHQQLGVYGLWDGSVTYVTAAGLYDHDEYRSMRRVEVAQMQSASQSTYGGDQAAVYVEVGGMLQQPLSVVQPFVGCQYAWLQQDALVEVGSGPFDLSVDALEMNSLRSVCGGRLFGTHPAGSGARVVTETRALWLHEYLDRVPVVRSTLAVGGPPVLAGGNAAGRDWAVLGGSLGLMGSRGRRFTADYDLFLGTQEVAHLVSLGLEQRW
ncbi:MAG: autotransporter outer membrane beta-barrel domain-containing protein [Pirellulaceae bacterium]|jgi:uncharacterized protein with beta-barrel porin domain|nr:autotransporter outer membrane beta-barrel domain-containing protein [Pirellulaceae bacterium]